MESKGNSYNAIPLHFFAFAVFYYRNLLQFTDKLSLESVPNGMKKADTGFTILQLIKTKARFKHRTSHVPNLMHMMENRFFSFASDSVHLKLDV